MNVLASAAPPIEGGADLVAWLEAGSKPESDWRIGTEHEKFGFRTSDLRPMTYEGEAGIAAVLEGMAERFGWQPVREDGNIIALSQDGQAITLEPGGQVELSGSPLPDIHETCVEVNAHLRQIKAVAGDLGVGFLGLGFQPKWGLADIPLMPKQRYRIMKHAMPATGPGALDMMLRTCTVQVNLDFGSEADMVRKFRVSLALQPVATALFASSPFTDGAPNGYRSYRAQTWWHTDPARTRLPEAIFEDGMGFERYVDWALDIPMYFVVRDNGYLPVHGQTFRDFLAGNLEALPGQRPNLADWELHLTTLFPDVRMKRFLEMRGADGGTWARLCALPALWVGLLYDGPALDAAWDLVKGWSAADRAGLVAGVARHALAAPSPPGAPGPTVRALADEVLQIAGDGLRRRNRVGSRSNDERRYLRTLLDIVDKGRTQADELLALYEGRWSGSVDPVFREFAY